MGVDRTRLPALGPDPAFRLPDLAKRTLRNGLELRTIEHTHAPLVSFVLQIDGGSGADPDAREGLAAVVADMADEGTGSLTAIDVSDALARIGAEYDVDVAPDVTTFTLTTLTRFAARGATLLSDLVLRPSHRDRDFQRVRQLRVDRLRQLKDVAPAVAERTFLRLLYAQHPYGHAPIGNETALRAMTIEEVERFHAATVRPRAAVLVVAGPMSHDELARLGEEVFGSWTGTANGPAPAAAALSEPPAGTARLTIVPREGAAQSELRIGHLAAHRTTPDYSALLVMNAALGGQFVSRVNLKLREEKGYTYGARTAFDWRRGLSPFALQASVHTAATADAVRDALREIDEIRGARPLTADELALAKASLTKGYPRNFETVQQVARSVAQLSLYGLPDDYFEDFVPKVNAVTAEQVTAVAARYLDPARLTTLVVGDHAAVGDSLRGLGLGELEVRAPEA